MAFRGTEFLVSDLTIDELSVLDANIAQVISDANIDTDATIDRASDYLNRVFEYDWWPSYAQRVGTQIYRNDAVGSWITNYEPAKLLKDHSLLIDVHGMYTLYLMYRRVAPSSTNINEPDLKNMLMWEQQFEKWFERLIAASDFYDLNLDGEIDKNEEEEPQPNTQRNGYEIFR